MEVHYINTGFPYTITESFMDFFEDLTHVPVNYAQVETMHNQVRLISTIHAFIEKWEKKMKRKENKVCIL